MGKSASRKAAIRAERSACDHQFMTDQRGFKKFMRLNGMSDPIYLAHTEGEATAHYGRSMPPRLRTNPYPAGKRHDSWERGYQNADPLGEWHGRNA